jgi:hypothetical protein
MVGRFRFRTGYVPDGSEQVLEVDSEIGFIDILMQV